MGRFGDAGKLAVVSEVCLNLNKSCFFLEVSSALLSLLNILVLVSLDTSAFNKPAQVLLWAWNLLCVCACRDIKDTE